MAINTKGRISPFSKRKKVIFVCGANLLTEFESRTLHYTEKSLWYIFGIAGIGNQTLWIKSNSSVLRMKPLMRALI